MMLNISTSTNNITLAGAQILARNVPVLAKLGMMGVSAF
jgi:hypothetical protein